jgi:hypothetical protein
MQKVLNLIMKRKVSTKRVDDMADARARMALDKRLNRMLAAHATQPVAAPRHFEPLSNPIQKPQNP